MKNKQYRSTKSSYKERSDEVLLSRGKYENGHIFKSGSLEHEILIALQIHANQLKGK